jgi:NAD(P)-dependent dehydrogenase (short-subunit alcohol dehydrogenase family)
MKIDFTGKVGLVTGGGSGIGAAAATAYAKAGGAIVIADYNAEAARALAQRIEAAGGRALAVQADVTRLEDIERMVGAAVETYGRLDLLHNNAYGFVAAPASLAETSDTAWQHGLDVGLTACYRAMRLAIPIMQRQGGGAIVNTASISGLFADTGMAAYNSAKAGLINLTRVVACEYGADGIRANCICPGVIDTPILQTAFAVPGLKDAAVAQIPLRRLGRPEDVANLVLFLASDLAAFITGGAYVIDGGQTLETRNVFAKFN